MANEDSVEVARVWAKWCATLERELATAQATIAAAQWTEIAPDNLPKMGDEVGCFADDGCCVYDVCDIHLRFTYEVWVKKRAMTHFRPISPPAQASAAEKPCARTNTSSTRAASLGREG